VGVGDGRFYRGDAAVLSGALPWLSGWNTDPDADLALAGGFRADTHALKIVDVISTV
jgi:hypothetical protein